MQFEDLRLNQSLLRAVRAAGYRTPTPIQANAIPIVLEGRDVLGCAQTGTGKTAAFALPLLHRLSERAANQGGFAGKRVDRFEKDRPAGFAHKRRKGQPPHRRNGARSAGPIRSLVLCPTRELAQQIRASFVTYGAHTGIRTTAIFGGVNQNSQVRALRAGADVVIATPGRLLDLMQQGFVNLASVEILVLDEADRMLDMGFLPDIRRILDRMPRQRQSLLFSATMPPPIRKLASDMLSNPVPLQMARVSSPAPTVDHKVYHVDQRQKASLLVHLLAHASGDRALVFSRTKHGADRIALFLAKAGVRAAALHGNKSQNARNRALDGFRSGKVPVLVATDIAARGLDVDQIAQVINFDMTPEPETYVHRIGRTGRAGASGTAVSFCTTQERGSLRAIERLLRTQLQHTEIPQLSGMPKIQVPRPNLTVRDDSKRPDRQRTRRNKQRHDIREGTRRHNRRRPNSASRSTASARS